MDRVPGLRYSLFEAREALRIRLRRLPALDLPSRTFWDEDQPLAKDTDVLALLLDTTRISNGEFAAASAEYASRRAITTDLPEFDEASARGWFRDIWGELTAAWGVRDYFRYREPEPVYAEALTGFLRWLHEISYCVANTGSHGTADPYEQLLVKDEIGGQPIRASSPEWVAARLWEAIPDQNLQQWEAKWALLGKPRITPGNAWTEALAVQFRDAVLHAIRNAGLVPDTTADWVAALRTDADVRIATEDGPLTPHLLGRYLRAAPGTRGGSEGYDAEKVAALVGILVQELPQVHSGPAPSPVAETLAELAMAYPDVRDALIGYLHQAPEAIADFLLCPRAAALMTFLVANWHREVPWDREDRRHGGTQLQNSLVEDCLTVLRTFMVQGTVNADEYAGLSIALRELDARTEPQGESPCFGANHIQDLPATLRVPVRTALVAAASGKFQTAGFAVMLHAIAQSRSTPLSQEICATLMQTYQNAFNEAGATPDVSWIDHVAAGTLAHIAMQQPAAGKAKLLVPIDVPARIASSSEGSTYTLGLALRAHIRMLCRAIAGYPETVPDELVNALVASVRAGARERPSRGQIDALRLDLEVSLWRTPRPLEIDLVDAINRLDNAEQQKRLVTALLETEEPVVLAVLLQRLPPIHHGNLRHRLGQLTPDQASLAHSVPQMRRRVQALLDVGLPDIAEQFMTHQRERLGDRQVRDGQVEALRATLQLQYLRADMNAIAAAIVPHGLQEEARREANRTIDFYRALALLRKEPPEAVQAAAIFQNLHSQVPTPSYAINLLAARVSKLLHHNVFGTLEGEAAEQGASALRQADAAIPDQAQLSVEGHAIHAPNRATLQLAIGRPHDALRTLAELAPAARSAASMAFEAVANARLGDPARATSLIRSAKERFGSEAVVLGAENHIAHAALHPATTRALTHEARENDIRASLKLFSELPPSEQAAILSPGALALERIMVDAVRESLAAFDRINPFLQLQSTNFSEDEYTAFIAEILQARVDAMLGWQPGEQSPGGFTQAGNAGRRDFVIKRRGTELAVFEALIASRPRDVRLIEHFHKLFAYSRVDLFFHVTYAFREDMTEMETAVRALAAQPPDGTTLTGGVSEIPAEGTKPSGIRGSYRSGGRDVAVYFFVIDMRKTSMRQAIQAPAVPVATATLPAAPSMPGPTGASIPGSA